MFPPSKVNNPGFFGDFWNPLVEQGLDEVFNGTPDWTSSAKQGDQVIDWKTQDKLDGR